MKIRVIGDLHLGSLQEDLTRKNVDILCKSINDTYANITVLLGDVFDHHNIGTRAMETHKCLDVLDTILETIKNKTQSDIYIIHGNHDVTSMTSSIFLSLSLQGVTVINKPTLLTRDKQKLAFWPWMYNGQHSISAITDSNAILFGHCLWKEIIWGNRYKSDAFNTFTTQELMCFNSTFLGHVHYRYSSDTIHSVGQPWHTRFFGNKGQEKAAVPGYAIFDTEDPNPFWVDIDTVKFINCYTEQEYELHKNSGNRLSLHFITENPISENVTIARIKPEKTEVEISSIDPSTMKTIEDCWHYWCNNKNIQDKEELGEKILSEINNTKSLGRVVSPIDFIEKISCINLGNHSSFELCPGEATSIIGTYGSGKTMILEIILLALYGNSPTRGNMLSLISHGKDYGTVSVILRSGKRTYTITRKVDAKTHSHTIVVELGGKEISPKKRNEAESYIESIFGTYEMATATWFMCQRQAVGSLVNTTPAVIERIMRNILGQESLDDIYKSISALSNAQSKDVARITADIAKVIASIRELPSKDILHRQIKEYDSQNIKQAIEYKDKVTKLNTYKTQIIMYENLLKELLQIENNLSSKDAMNILLDISKANAAEETIRSLKKAIETNTDRMKGATAKYILEYNKRIEDSHCSDCSFLNNYKEIMARYTAEISDLQKKISDLSSIIIDKVTVHPIYSLIVTNNSGTISKMISHLCDKQYPLSSFTGNDIVNMLNDMIHLLQNNIILFETELSTQSPTTTTLYTISPRDILAILNSKELNLEGLQKDRNNAILKDDTLRALRACFAPGGVPYMISSFIIPEINLYLDTFSEQLNIPFTIEMKQTPGRGGKNEFAFSATIRNNEQDILSCSTGEKLLADICIRLAFMKIVCGSRILLADEVYEGLPDTVRDTLLEVLMSTTVIDQVIFSTHIDVSTDSAIILL